MKRATRPNEEFVELTQFTVDPRAVRLLDHDFCRARHAVVLAVPEDAAEPVTVGLLDPGRRALVREIERALGRRVAPVRLNAWEIERALDEGFHAATFESEGLRLALRPVHDFSFERNPDVSLLLDEILGRAVGAGASDVHLETYEADVDVRLRIDGVLEQVATPLARGNVQGAITRLKVLAGLDIAERRRAQDGRIAAVFREDGRQREVDFRLSIVPGPFGEDAVLRILDSETPLMGLSRLGLGGAAYTTFERLISNPEGLVLLTGPTGSGKTTTLYASIQHISRPDNKVITVEDPIEYHFPKTNQKQVSGAMGFADYARAFLRQNPDIILIGEIRDEETASAAIRAAQTGHLVLSTLHTNDAVRTISRLRTLGVDPSLIASCLLGAASQRLLRRLCPECKEPAAPKPEEAERLRLGAGDEAFFRARGCAACSGRGFRGRVGIYELFVMDGELADLVADDVAVHRLREAALKKGMETLVEHALHKAREGITSLAEILREVPYRLLTGD